MCSQLNFYYLEVLEGTLSNGLTLDSMYNFFLKENQKGITHLLIQHPMTEALSKLGVIKVYILN